MLGAQDDTIRKHFACARVNVAGVEAERVLAQVNERLFGVASDPLEIGHFVILRRLGAGGMGVVYLGYDQKLDRNVALKLLRAQATGNEAPAHAEARLLREARALARVDHPNVIAIYEVGTDGDAVFLAMERVEGSTLGEWQQSQARPWQQTLELYRQAGRGLAAAHAAGIVHRDFKPNNVLVSQDTEGMELRARVVDFGLARPLEAGDLLVTHASGASLPNKRALYQDLTKTGAQLGTPAYMAPEQIKRRPADARSDQFSFALALHEALTGQRAFVGEDIESFHSAVLTGQRRPTTGKFPRWLRRILDRALEIAPNHRFPSMQALLAQIEAGLRARRRRGLWIGGAVVALVAGLLGSAAVRPEACRGGANELADIWGDNAKAKMKAAFLATGKPFAAKAYTETSRRIDVYAQSWIAMHDDTCAATVLRQAQSPAALDLRMACLDRRQSELAVLLEVFSDAPEPGVVSRAVEASDALTPLQGCADLDALSAPETLPDDPRIKTRVTTLRGQLDRAKALRDAGQYADGLAIATQVDAEASTISYGPLLAESALLLGTLRGLTGEAERAGADLDRSFTAALASGHMEVAMWASIHAVHAVGYVGHHEQEGRRWAHLATPLLTRLGMPARAQATLEANLGNVAVVQGELDEAEEHFHSAIDIIETSLGEHDVLMAKTLANLGAVSRRRGAYKRALASYERAGVLVRLNFGPRHPSNATISNSIGAVHHTMGDVETAEKHYRAVLALGGDSISATSPTLGYAHNNLGELIAERGQDELATGHFLAALRIWEESRGPDHPLLAHALVALGRAQINLGQPQAAVAHLLRAKKLRHGDEEGLRKVQVELDRLNSPTVPKTPE